MRKLVMAAAFLAAVLLPAKADIIGTGTFFSDHCTNFCGPQSNGFATITGVDHQNGVIDITITMLNGNLFANGGQDVVFGFNLVGNPTITYSGLNTTFFDVANSLTNVQNAGSLAADGFGTFEYGIEGLWNGCCGPASATFTISGAGLTLASFAELSHNPPGDTQAFFALDIWSGTNGNTGFVDLSGGPTPFCIGPCTVGVPGPIVGAGLPGLVAACMFLLGIARHRRNRRFA